MLVDDFLHLEKVSKTAPVPPHLTDFFAMFPPGHLIKKILETPLLITACHKLKSLVAVVQVFIHFSSWVNAIKRSEVAKKNPICLFRKSKN